MRAHRRGRDHERAGDLRRRHLAAHQLEHLPLARGQPRLALARGHQRAPARRAVAELLDQARDQRHRQRGLAGHHVAQRARQPLGLGVLEQVARRARAQRREDVAVVARDRQHDHARRRQPRRDLPRRGEPAAGHVDVEQREVGLLAQRRVHRPRRVLGRGDDRRSRRPGRAPSRCPRASARGHRRRGRVPDLWQHHLDESTGAADGLEAELCRRPARRARASRSGRSRRPRGRCWRRRGSRSRRRSRARAAACPARSTRTWRAPPWWAALRTASEMIRISSARTSGVTSARRAR